MHMSRVLQAKGCNCSGAAHMEVLMLRGVKVLLCLECMDDVKGMVLTHSSRTLHTLTFHTSRLKHDNMNVPVLSFSTGAVMRWVTNKSRWIDSKTDIDFELGFRERLCHLLYVLSPLLSI